MSEPPERMKEVARWTEKAEHDYIAADHAMELAQEGLTDQSLRMGNRGLWIDDSRLRGNDMFMPPVVAGGDNIDD